jgi:DNA-binding NtrC family response regulator
MPTHILQVAYYDALQELRAEMLRNAGYQVTSVLGNNEAMALDATVIAAADLVLVGFSADRSIRSAIVHWFKVHYPSTPVVILQSHDCEMFPEADMATSSEDPASWLAEIATTLRFKT